jgi:hypothetical protein
MYAETVIVDYRLSFADQGKQTSIFSLQQNTEVCHFHFLFAAKKWKFPFSVSSFFRVCAHTVCRCLQQKWKAEAANMAPTLPETY